MIKAIKGTKDILPDSIEKWKYVESIISLVFKNYNYKEIRTPIFEETSLFARGIGEETDIVGKEMYTFEDRSKTSVTLKPEMTASVVRAFIQHSLGKKQSLNKLYYISPMFRQERPQAGRLREFHQFGAEALGSGSPILDVEMITMAYDILSGLGLKDLTIKINSLGTPESRQNYIQKLKEYLIDKESLLSGESKERMSKNILRIFDSKLENDIEVMQKAPVLLDYIDNESKEDFEKVKSLLTSSKIPFEIDASLVRGLDYYTKTTFEIVSGKVGSQSALCGGGRYDLLVEQLGGEPTPGTGFAAGIERILIACENENSFEVPGSSINLYIVCLEKNLMSKAYEKAQILRKNNITIELDYLGRSIKAQMREANKLNAKYVLFFGGDEYKLNKAQLKNMETGEQEIIELKNILNKVKNNYASDNS